MAKLNHELEIIPEVSDLSILVTVKTDKINEQIQEIKYHTDALKWLGVNVVMLDRCLDDIDGSGIYLKQKNNMMVLCDKKGAEIPHQFDLELFSPVDDVTKVTCTFALAGVYTGLDGRARCGLPLLSKVLLT